MKQFIKLPCINNEGKTHVVYLNLYDITSVCDHHYPKEGCKYYYNVSLISMRNSIEFVINMTLDILLELISKQWDIYNKEVEFVPAIDEHKDFIDAMTTPFLPQNKWQEKIKEMKVRSGLYEENINLTDLPGIPNSKDWMTSDKFNGK